MSAPALAGSKNFYMFKIFQFFLSSVTKCMPSVCHAMDYAIFYAINNIENIKLTRTMHGYNLCCKYHCSGLYDKESYLQNTSAAA